MPDFEREGIPPSHRLAAKLWVASKVLGGHAAGGPFGKRLVEHTPAELDFILEMAARDEPDKYAFRRAGTPDPMQRTEAGAAWYDRALGGSLRKSLEAATARARAAAHGAQRLRPGLTRGGKPVRDDG